MKQRVPIPGFEGEYSVTADGEVFSHRAGRVLRGSSGGRGYRLVILRREGARHPFYVHRIVASIFIRPPLAGETVNHIDGDKLNNKASNLEWCSPGDNLRHARRLGLNKSAPPVIRGDANVQTRLTDAQVIEARKRRLAGAKNIDLARAYGITAGAMSNILRGKKRGLIAKESVSTRGRGGAA